MFRMGERVARRRTQEAGTARVGYTRADQDRDAAQGIQIEAMSGGVRHQPECRITGWATQIR